MRSTRCHMKEVRHELAALVQVILGKPRAAGVFVPMDMKCCELLAVGKLHGVPKPITIDERADMGFEYIVVVGYRPIVRKVKSDSPIGDSRSVSESETDAFMRMGMGASQIIMDRAP